MVTQANKQKRQIEKEREDRERGRIKGKGEVGERKTRGKWQIM